MAQPASKKQKTETSAADVEMKDADKTAEKPKVAEPPKELEEDAPQAAGPKVKEAITFLTPDTTLNFMQSANGDILMPVSDGGLRHLLAGARASVGLKSGRYMFEARILESVARGEDGNKPTPKNLLKIGFSTAKSSLLMGSDATDISFSSDGGLYHMKKQISQSPKFGNLSVMAVVLNLDKSSPNANTISLFRDGKRMCQPVALPESLHGKVLYPTVTYRNVCVNVNFGPRPMASLPFTCTMVKEATIKDSAVSTVTAPKDGKYEVVYPTCLPDEGGYDWLDMFKSAHPDYTELSDRMIKEWAERSGIWCGPPVSNDKPELKFGIADMDDGSITRMIRTLAPLQQRNYIVMDIYGSLHKEMREVGIKRFSDDSFKKVSYVVVGDPTAEFKKKTLQLVLADKQELSDVQFRKEKAEEAKKKAMEKKQKEMEKAKKKAEKEKLKKIEEIKKAAEKAKKDAERKKAAAEGKELPEEPAEEEKKDEEMEDEDEAEEPDEPMVEENPPKVELTAEEKKTVFRKLRVPDLTLYLLNTSFAKYTLPEKGEGFEEIRYEWSKGSKASEYLKKWIQDRKQTSRVEDLVPSEWFRSKSKAWQEHLTTWKQKQHDYKAKIEKKHKEKTAKLAAKVAKKAAAAKAAAAKAAAAKAAAEKAKKEGKQEEGEKKEEEKPEEPEDADAEEEEAEEEEVDFAGVDIFGVDEVDDIGGGTPLFKEFGYEDWALARLGFELHLMSYSFKKDCTDEDRLGVVLEHLPFYYKKYYGNDLDFKHYGVENASELVSLVKEYVFVNDSKVLESLMEAEIEYPQIFVKIAEETRRHRALLLDLGDESAKLKINKNHSGGGNWKQGQGGGNQGGGNWKQGGGNWKQGGNWNQGGNQNKRAWGGKW
eukprot:TRINITY_DN234_c0_g1_i1.p1 TRINITY_DN234_c0_g1~~TRINITY_DN234_c0_g1_i1.p1  ORF type:complete len:881 (+),score=282.92 TRINITY_DN234_c0_g1_i1:72-2714(+)